MFDMRFKLDTLMQRKGLKTAYALANYTGLPITTATRLVKRPVKRIDFATLDVLCAAFGVPVGKLLEADPPPDED